ncbi:hypothetical protein DRQ36_00975, partial [bacterium]
MTEAKDKILQFLSKGRAWSTLVYTAGGAILALGTISILSVLLVLFNGVFYLETGARSALFFLWLAVVIVSVLLWVFRPLIKTPGYRRVAIGLEDTYPQLESRLVSAYDLMKIDPERLGYSSELVDASVSDTGKQIESLNPRKLAPLRILRERFAFLGFALILLVGFLAAFPTTFHTGLIRGSNPFGFIPRPTLTTLSVEPGDTQVTKYGNLEISISSFGKLPEEVTVYRSFESGSERGFRAEQNANEIHNWSFVFEDCKRDFTYRVTGGDFESRPFEVKIVDRPRVVGLTLILNYPNYTGLETQRLEENEGTIDVPYGTTVTIEARFSKKLQSGTIVFSDTTQLDLKIENRVAKASFRAIKHGSYHIRAIDTEGLENDDPIEYPIRIRMDEYPTVEITNPGVDIDLTEDMLLPLSILAEDDYGFTHFDLNYYTEDSPEDTGRIRLPFDALGEPQVSLGYIWNLANMGLVPNDIVLYWVEVFDNDRVTGPKKAVSRVYSARFPSIDEIIEEVTKERSEQITDVEEVARQEQELQEELRELTREMRQESEISYEQREDLREALKRQQELLEQLEQTSEEYQQTTEKVADQQLAAMEVIEKMMEIQKLLDEVATEEMREAMKRLQEALQSMDQEELRRAAEQFQLTQEELLQRLDRTLALLKRMQVEQRIEDMKALADKLKEMEDKVRDGLENGNMSQNDMERMQDRITQGSELLEKGIEELADMMSEFPDMPAGAAQQLSENLKQNSPSQQSKQCKASMQSGAMKQCSGQAGDLSEQFGQTSEQLSQMMQQMQMALSQEVLAAIRRAVFSLLDLSARQEELLGAIARDPRSADIARSLSEDGANISAGLDRVANE